jgi:hypothetical protein
MTAPNGDIRIDIYERLDEIKTLLSGVSTVTMSGTINATIANTVNVSVSNTVNVGNAVLSVGGSRTSIATFARPADTNGYTANDVVSDSTSAPTVLSFPSVVRTPGGSGYITYSQLMTQAVSFTAITKLHLFSIAPTAINDNAPYATLWANRASRIGVIDMPAATAVGSSGDASVSQNDSARLFFATEAGTTSIFGVLSTAAFTPASAQPFHLVLRVDPN